MCCLCVMFVFDLSLFLLSVLCSVFMFVLVLCCFLCCCCLFRSCVCCLLLVSCVLCIIVVVCFCLCGLFVFVLFVGVVSDVY